MWQVCHEKPKLLNNALIARESIHSPISRIVCVSLRYCEISLDHSHGACEGSAKFWDPGRVTQWELGNDFATKSSLWNEDIDFSTRVG